MSVLNYSQIFNSTSGNKDGIDWLINATSHSEDWLKIAFAPDTNANGAGHLVTHGLDFLKDYFAGNRGMVPTAIGFQPLTQQYFRGTGWHAYYNATDEQKAGDALINGVAPTPQQKQDQIDAYRQNTLVSAYDIKNWINQSFAAQDALRFRGVINLDVDGNITTTYAGTGQTVNGFPTSCTVGDVYKITSAINGQSLLGLPVQSGDMLIGINDGMPPANVQTPNYWSVVQGNVEYLSKLTINGKSMQIYSFNAFNNEFYAPTSEGAEPAANSVGGTVYDMVVWKNGGASWASSAGLSVNYASTSGQVSKNLLCSGGIAFTAGTSYNGSAERILQLLPASTTLLGGVKIDDGTIAGDASNPKPTVSINSGVIYLTRDNIVNALGYVPGNSAASTSLVLGDANTSTSNIIANTSSPFINYVNTSAAGVSTVGTAIGIVAGQNSGITVLGSSANTSIIIGSSIFTTTSNGVVPMVSATNTQTGSVDNVLTQAIAANTFVLGSDAKWYRMPASAFEGTWRAIKVDGSRILDNSPQKDTNGNIIGDFELVTHESVGFAAVTDNNNNPTGAVIAGLRWYNIDLPDSDPNKYESIW